MADVLSLNNLLALVMLTLLEIVRAIDNILFVAIVADRVEAAKRSMVARAWLMLALGGRLALLLLGITWVLTLSIPDLGTLAGGGGAG